MGETDGVFISEKGKAFWNDFGERILDQLCDDVPIPTDVIYPVDDGIVLEQVRYKKRGKDKIHTKWLQKPLKESKVLVCGCIWRFYPIAIIPRENCPHDLKKAAYCYMMSVIKYDQSKLISTEHSRIIALWDGAQLKKEIISIEEHSKFPYKFAFPKRYIAKVNRLLEQNYLPQLWEGRNCAFWHPAGGAVPHYMGALNVSTEDFTGETEHLKEICHTGAGAVLAAYTCFSILKPFFSSYHQLNKQSPYLQVKKQIENLVAVNICSRRPEDAEKLVQCCCGYFDLNERHIVGPVIDGINILSGTTKRPELGVDEFERSILQLACVLWVNRVPAEELTVSGRIIDLQVDELPSAEELTGISRYLAASLSISYSEYLSRKRSDVTHSLEEKRALAAKSFADRIGALAKEHSVSLEGIDLNAESCEIAESEKYSLAIKCAKKSVLRIKCSMPDYMGSIFGMEQSEVNHNRAFRQRLDQLLRLFKKELKDIYDTDSPTKNHYQNAIREFQRNDLTHGLDKRLIKKAAYLSASFRIFAELCLPKEDQRPLIEKVDGALISAMMKQTGQESAQDILEKYLIGLIESGQYARIRGTHKEGKRVAVWYDPAHDIFLLPSGTYFDEIKDRFNLKRSKRRFEDDFVENGIILYDTTKRGQRRKTFECVLEVGKKRVSAVKIQWKKLSDSFAENDSVRQAIEEMRSDSAPLRRRKG